MNRTSITTKLDRPIAARDARRLADFFDKRMGAAYAFARAVWLPDALKTLEHIAGAIAASNDRDIVFLCDHLREGARSVGAQAFISGATQIELCFVSGNASDAAKTVCLALKELRDVDAWLERRSQPRRRKLC